MEVVAVGFVVENVVMESRRDGLRRHRHSISESPHGGSHHDESCRCGICGGRQHDGSRCSGSCRGKSARKVEVVVVDVVRVKVVMRKSLWWKLLRWNFSPWRLSG